MEFEATAKYVRMSPRKVRLVAREIRSLKALQALRVLGGMTKRATLTIEDVLSSAMANAKEKRADVDRLTLKTIEVMGAPVMKRWRAVSRGTAHAYKKRMTHIRIVLTDDEIKDQKSKVKESKQK